MKLSAPGSYFDDTMSLGNTLPLRGIFAIAIVIHHFSSEFSPPYLLGLFTHIGYFFVALFFFLSGYGLAFGYKRDSGYIRFKTFIPKRFFNTIIPYWLCVLFTAGVFLLDSTPFGLRWFLTSFISDKSIVKHAWYVFVILILYAAFMLIFRIKNRKIALTAMFAFIAALYVVFMVQDYSLYARSSFAFIIGILYCFYDKVIDEFVKKRFAAKLILTVLIFAVLCAARYLFVAKGSYWLDNIFATLSSSVFAVLVFVLLTKKVRLGNPVLNFIGKISYEIYLMHAAFCHLLRPAHLNMLLYFAAVVICTVICAMIINALSKLITAPFFKKTLPQKSE